MVISQPGVWYTGDRHTGTVNGSGLVTCAICSPENVEIFFAEPDVHSYGSWRLRRRRPGSADVLTKTLAVAAQRGEVRSARRGILLGHWSGYG